MNEIKSKKRFRKPSVIAAVAALCLCFTFALAAVSGGYFRNVKNMFGTVTGTAYEQATDEISVTAESDGNTLTVRAVMLTPTAVPYREIETLGLESFTIVDKTGKTVITGESTGLMPVENGEAEITVPLTDLPVGSFTLKITAFTGGSKADSPIQIYGNWEYTFTV